MARLQKGDSIMLAVGDDWEITSEHSPTTRVGRLLARFFAPVESITVHVASINVVGGVPCARLEVVATTS